MSKRRKLIQDLVWELRKGDGMKNETPFIHLFKTIEKSYLYDVNTNTIVPVDHDIYEYLHLLLTGKKEDIFKNLSSEHIQKAEAWGTAMANAGFLSSSRPVKIKHPMDKYLEGFLELRLENLILQITQACNLRCSYCTYSGEYKNRTHSAQHMKEETAKKAIDYFIAHSAETPKPAFSFYGGEPLLHFGLIKKSIQYIKKKMRGKEFTLHMTTNGTLINKEIIRFLASNNVHVLVSLDGPVEIHNKNRCFGSGRGSYEQVMKSVEMMRAIAPSYAEKYLMFSTVITEEEQFCSLSRFFTDYETVKDYNVIASSKSDFYLKDQEKKEPNYQYYDDVNYEMLKYMLYRQGRVDEKYISKLVKTWAEKELKDMEEKRDILKLLPDVFHPGGPCIPGVRRLFVTTNGNLFPCERVSEISSVSRIGSLETGIDPGQARKILNIGSLTEKECRQCWASRFCIACVSCADNGEELDRTLKLSQCREIRKNTEYKFIKYCIYREFQIPTKEKAVG
jgi:uncharacterized protein